MKALIQLSKHGGRLLSATLAIAAFSLWVGVYPAAAQKGGGTKPPAPTGLTASSPVLRQIALTWNAVGGATSYKIYRGLPSDRRLSLVATRTATNHVDSGLAANTVYRYAVTALNSVGESTATYVNGLSLSGLPTGANPAIACERRGSLAGMYVMDANGANATRIGISFSVQDWSPDGMKLLYSNNDGLWTCNRDGTGATRIVNLPGSLFARWSPVPTPDGSYRIVYSNGDIWVVRPDGTDNVQLTFTPLEGEGGATWSPDASRLAVVCGDDSLVPRVKVLDLGFNGSTLFESGRTTVIDDLTEDWRFLDLDWCRTGDPALGRPDRIAFVASVYDAYGNHKERPYILDPTALNSYWQLLPTTWTANVETICWTPDDSQLVFSAYTGQINDTIYGVDADGLNPTPLATGSYPRWRRNP